MGQWALALSTIPHQTDWSDVDISYDVNWSKFVEITPQRIPYIYKNHKLRYFQTELRKHDANRSAIL